MKQTLTRTLDTIFPDKEQLWERGGATLKTVEIEPGHGEVVPFFYTDLAENELKSAEPVLDRLHRQVGTVFQHDVLLGDGVDRAVKLFLPSPEIAAPERFMLHMDTPWFTGVGGHNSRIAEIFMMELGVPVMVVGPEFSTTQRSPVGELRRLGATALGSVGISQSRSAEDSMTITRRMADMYGLPETMIKVGESRGAMHAMGEGPYAEAHGLEIIYYDLTDPCVAEKIPTSMKNALQMAKWPVTEALGSLAVGIGLLRAGHLRREIDTVPLNPNFHVSAIAGVGPALVSGEAGSFPPRIPRDAGIHLVNFKRNPLSSSRLWREKFAEHEAFASANLKGTHLSLAYPSVQRHVVDRIKKFSEEYTRTGGDTSAIDWTKVHIKPTGTQLEAVA